MDRQRKTILRLWKVCAAAVLWMDPAKVATAFSPAPHHCLLSSRRASRMVRHLTSEEILANARKAAGLPAEEPQPMLFEQDILNDMQSVLLKLERRAKEGEGVLSMLEVEEMDLELKRILVEMRANPDKTLPRPASPQAGAMAAPEAPATAFAASTEAMSAPAVETDVHEHNEEEGPAYDGRGGMGQARGTRNTYVIPGMDEMDTAEYRAALQQSLIDRQAQRRATGVTGNRATWDYLNHLSGDSGVLKKEQYE